MKMERNEWSLNCDLYVRLVVCTVVPEGEGPVPVNFPVALFVL